MADDRNMIWEPRDNSIFSNAVTPMSPKNSVINDATFTDSQNRRGQNWMPTAEQTGSSGSIIDALANFLGIGKGENAGRSGWVSSFGQYGGNSDLQMDEFTNPTITNKYNEQKSVDMNAPKNAEEATSRGSGYDPEYGEYTKDNQQSWDAFRNAYIDTIIDQYGDGNGNLNLTWDDVQKLDSIGKTDGNMITYTDGTTGYMYSFPMDGLGSITLSNGDVIDNGWFERMGLMDPYNDVMQTGRYDTSAGSRSLLGLTPDSYAGGNFIQSASSNFLGQKNPYSANQGVTYLTAEQIANDPLQNLITGNGKNVNQFGDRSALPYIAWMERTNPARAAALNDASEYGSYLY